MTHLALHIRAFNFAAVVCLFAGCENTDSMSTGFELQVMNASDSNLDQVAVHSGGLEFGIGVLSSGDYGVLWVEQELGTDLTFTYLSEANEKKKFDLGPTPENYMGRAIVIKFQSEDSIQVLVQDKVEI